MEAAGVLVMFILFILIFLIAPGIRIINQY